MARNVLVTGGSGGIGRATVQRFAADGDHVWFTYRSGKDRAEALVAASPKGRVEALSYDQGDWGSLRWLLSVLPERVDVLINNAGLGSKTVERYAKETHAQDEALMRVNAVGPLWLTQAILPRMRKHGYGKIVNVSSVGGGVNQYPNFRLSDGMSKAALAFMSRQLAAETAHEPIDVFAVCPGATDTDMFQASTLNHLSDEERTRLVARLPKSRLIEPDEIAALIHFLCTDPARVLHGAVLDASLGLGVHPGLLTGANK